MIYQGSCHCGKVAFEVEVQNEPGPVLACNCSICERRGSLLWFVSQDKLTLKTPSDAAATYTFNKHAIAHRFCATCGIHTHGEAADPQGKRVAAINVRCLAALDLAALPVRHFDGRAVPGP